MGAFLFRRSRSRRLNRGGGMVTYLPIPFASSLRITESGQTCAKDYYNINYAIYPAGTPITTFTGNEDRTAAEAVWTSVGTNPNPADPTDAMLSGSATVAAGATSVLTHINGPGEISELRLNVPGLNSQNAASLLSSLQLQIAWDGEANASVDAPIGDFFGTGVLNGTVQSAAGQGRTMETCTVTSRCHSHNPRRCGSSTAAPRRLPT